MNTTLFTFLLSFCTVLTSFAHDLSGEWLGTRYQYDASKSKYIAEFDYRYNLTQEGSIVRGTAIIKSKGGKVAEMAVRGFVEGDRFYFEEYEVIQATRDENMLWCLKKGSLAIEEVDGKVNLEGATPSFMEIYGMECTGGVTQLSKEKTLISEDKIKEIVASESDINITVYPNPFVESTTLSFTNPAKQQVVIDVVDIQGKLVDVIENKLLEKGTYNLIYTPKPHTIALYYYIRIKMGDKTYTRPIQKADAMSNMR